MKSRRMLITDELREELAQAATATSHAYTVGARNLSTTSSSTAAAGTDTIVVLNMFIPQYYTCGIDNV